MPIAHSYFIWHSPWDTGNSAGASSASTLIAVNNSEVTNPFAAGVADWTVGLAPTSLDITIVDLSFTQSYTFSTVVRASDSAILGILSATYSMVAGVPQTYSIALSALPVGTTLKSIDFTSSQPSVSNVVVHGAAPPSAALAAVLACSASASMFVPLPGAIYANLFVRSTMPLPGSGGLVGGPLNGFYLIPDRGADRTIATSVRTEKFNGNYEQNRVEGINSVSESWSLAFTLRKRAEIELIDALFTSLNGRTSFPWKTPLNELKNFKCVNWDSTYYFDGNASLTCTLEQTFP